MLSSTLKEYIKNYPIELEAFLLDYEDNSEKLFLEKEYVKYFRSHNAMLKISDRLKGYPIEERSNIELFFNLGNDLRETNEQVYNDIVISKKEYPQGSDGPLEPLSVKVNYEKLENLITSSTLILKFITDKLIALIQASETFGNEKIIEKKYWFKIGLLFANGEMDRLLVQFNGNSTKIAKHLGNQKGFRPYISESIGINKATSKKSIFSDRQKMEKIILHCMSLNIPVTQHFKDSIPSK